ncbi:MAG TPA: putative toxin-antitoxin system toxin component, PIN family [Stellaceae bacterium]|nr:putative toxin-antitoxin system toxin component, PIN family [Stellaceae bacterium]
MRIILDTNIFVSILIRPGSSFSSLVDYIDEHATVLYSAETLTELVDVLRREKFAKYTTAKDVAAFVEWIASTGELVTVEEAVIGSRDPKDNKFLALAIAGRADYLVTGDKDLLVLGRIGATPIVAPSDFLNIVNH